MDKVVLSSKLHSFRAGFWVGTGEEPLIRVEVDFGARLRIYGGLIPP
jgi:hypothetical protein